MYIVGSFSRLLASDICFAPHSRNVTFDWDGSPEPVTMVTQAWDYDGRLINCMLMNTIQCENIGEIHQILVWFMAFPFCFFINLIQTPDQQENNQHWKSFQVSFIVVKQVRSCYHSHFFPITVTSCYQIFVHSCYQCHNFLIWHWITEEF